MVIGKQQAVSVRNLTVEKPKGEATETGSGAEPKDVVGDSFKEHVGANLISAGNTWKLGVGSAAGLATGGLGLYAGIIGGTAVGAAIGGGLSGAVASLTSEGVGGFLRTAFTTTTTAAFFGMAAGAVTGSVGGYKLGKGVASLPGVGAQALGKKMVGFDPNKETGKPGTMLGMKGVMEWVGIGTIGVLGAVPGALGGAALGGGAAALGSILSNGFSSSALTGAGAIGAVVGGAIGLATGITGGITVYNGIRRGGGMFIDGQKDAKQYIQLDEKDNRLKEYDQELKTESGKLGVNNQAADKEKVDRTANLDGRDKQLVVDNQRVADKNANVDSLIEKRAQNLYDTTKSALQVRDKGQDDRQVKLDSEDKRVNGRRENIQNEIDARQNQLFDSLKANLEASYQKRQGQLADRDRQLDSKEAQIPSTVSSKVEQALNPLRQELRQIESNTQQAQANAQNLQNQANRDRNSIPGVQQQTSQEQSAAAEARRRADNLRPEQNSLNSQVSSLRSENERRKSDLDRRESILQSQGK